MAAFAEMLERAPNMIDSVTSDMHRMVDYMGELRILAFVVTAASFIGGFIFALMKWAEMRENKRRERLFEQQFGIALPPQGYDIRGLAELSRLSQMKYNNSPDHGRYIQRNGYPNGQYATMNSIRHNNNYRNTAITANNDLGDRASIMKGEIMQPRQSLTNGSIYNGTVDPLIHNAANSHATILDQ